MERRDVDVIRRRPWALTQVTLATRGTDRFFRYFVRACAAV